MSNKEINQIEIFEKLVRKEIKQKKASEILGLSVRQIKRKLYSFKINGVKSLTHKSRGKISNNKVNREILDKAMDVIKEKYWDFGPTLAHEKLVEDHGIKISLSSIRKEMIRTSIWKPSKKRKIHTHHLRERRSCFGELVQLDGSPHNWFEDRGEYCNLNVIADDATSTFTIKFSKSETTNDYFKLLEEYIGNYGIPRSIYTDKHSIFRINNPSNLDLQKPNKNNQYEGLTQFGRACEELGIELIFANTAQAKGRVERANQTLQDRLVKEMRLKSISAIKEANDFALEYIKKFNTKFGVKPKSKIDMHRKLNKSVDLLNILCIKEVRVLSKNLTFQYENTIFQIKTKRPAFSLRKTSVTVCERPDWSIEVFDYKNRTMVYETIKLLPITKTISSKQLNAKLDDILIKEAKRNFKKKNQWESNFDELIEDNIFYRPNGAV